MASSSSVDLGIGDRGGALEEIEVASLVGLLYVAREDRAVAALVFPCRRFPAALAPLHFLGRNLQVELAFLHVELDQVAVPDQCERSADERLGRDMQHAAAVAR